MLLGASKAEQLLNKAKARVKMLGDSGMSRINQISDNIASKLKFYPQMSFAGVDNINLPKSSFRDTVKDLGLFKKADTSVQKNFKEVIKANEKNLKDLDSFGGITKEAGKDTEEYVKLYHGTSVDGANSIRTNGADLNHVTRDMDFERGFYTTTDKAQARRWIQLRFKGIGDIVEFNIPKSELDALNGKQFSSGDSEWLDFVTKSRKGMTNDYDYISGPMLMNSSQYLKYGEEPVASGQQTAFNTKTGVQLLNKYMKK